MLNVKSCNVTHNSESVFHYFASVVNSTYAIRSYSSLKKVGYVPLYTFRKSLFDIQRLGF